MKIHSKKRESVQFPRLSEDSYIEVRYFGTPRLIEFIANPNSQGTLEIAEEIQFDEKYSRGSIGGIICTDFEAVYFFLLTDNFDQLDAEEPEYVISEDTLLKMFSMIESQNLTPTSWFKIDYGFNGFNSMFLWEEVKESVIIDMVKDKYNYYIGKLLKTKQREDSIKQQIEQQYDKFSKIINKLESKSEQEGKSICPKCGEDIPQDSTFCPACGMKIDG